MDLYGYTFNENSLSMQKKAYFCKVHADVEVFAQKLNYYGTAYIKRGSIAQVINEAMADRKKMMEPALAYINNLLAAQKIYAYTSDDILSLCDCMSGKFVDAYMELCENICEITGQEAKEREVRELRKKARTKVHAIGVGIPNLAIGALEAGAINLTTGIVHSAFNLVGNTISAFMRMDMLSSIYESGAASAILQNGMKEDCKCLDKVLAAALSNVLGSEWKYPFSDVRIKEISSIVQNIYGGLVPKNEWPATLVLCIINGIPYEPKLYEFAEGCLGKDSGNLLKVAKFFSVYPYMEKCEREKRFEDYDEKCKVMTSSFFGNNLEEAEKFLEASDVYDRFYSTVSDKIDSDFNKMLSVIDEPRDLYKGDKELFFKKNSRRHVIVFEFDFSLMQKEREIKKYCELCHVNLRNGEIPYYFLDTTNFCSRKEGIVATNYGFYLSNPKTDNPLLYRYITAMKEGMLDSMDIFYKNKNAKVKLVPESQLNDLLVFTCMYFKYGKFDKR